MNRVFFSRTRTQQKIKLRRNTSISFDFESTSSRFYGSIVMNPVSTRRIQPQNMLHQNSSSSISFDFDSILRTKPFPLWLKREMRSNHAGETGAVYIYRGCISAIHLRQKYFPGNNWKEYETELIKFASEHERSEQHHLNLLDQILVDRNDVSSLLPLWKISGFVLGFSSTIWCPRGMYLTTEAVETFVEQHYKDQINRLEEEEEEEKVAMGLRKNNNKEENVRRRGRMELKRLLEFCCEDEIHHQREARDRASKGPFPWKHFLWIDTSWMFVVERGSSVGAEIAKRI